MHCCPYNFSFVSENGKILIPQHNLRKKKKLLANRKIIMVYWKHSHVSYMFFKDQLSFFKAYLLKCRYAAKLEMVTPHSSILWHLTLSLHI